MPQRSSSSAARQCLRLCHPQASLRTRLSSSKTLHPSPSASSCLYSSHPLNFRASSLSRSSFAPRPARPRQSWSGFRLRAPYSTSPPISSPESLSAEQYHELADSYIDSLLVHLEQLQEERADVDCEYSAGVLSLTFPPHGTYVLNKQPPNKQIWLSSPVSGPKRYDYVRLPDGRLDWVYLRDGSLLTGLLSGELGMKVLGNEG
ncbi:Mitochondrial chaperone Frataxin [Sticta canariensis]|nr:Mitochondrial chaperone Frataxin [Sticta canariensis]